MMFRDVEKKIHRFPAGVKTRVEELLVESQGGQVNTQGAD